MVPYSIDPVSNALFCLGGGGLLLSLTIGLAPSSRALAVLLQILAAVVGLGAATYAGLGIAFGWSVVFWMPPLAVLLVYLLLIVAPSPLSLRCLAATATTLHQPRTRRIVMIALWWICPFAGLALVAMHTVPEVIISDEELAASVRPLMEDVQAQPLEHSPLTTDRGRPLSALRLAPTTDSLILEALEAQERLLDRAELRDQAIHLPLGWQNCNCHGFVFTAGAYWILSAEVDAILEDNDYQTVTQPRVGDIAVYRDHEGQVSHTGVVCGQAAAVVLVESKWGKVGRFIHRHDRHPYDNHVCEFYRSARPGHLLRGVSPEGLVSASIPPAFTHAVWSEAH